MAKLKDFVLTVNFGIFDFLSAPIISVLPSAHFSVKI